MQKDNLAARGRNIKDSWGDMRDEERNIRGLRDTFSDLQSETKKGNIEDEDRNIRDLYETFMIHRII